MQIGVVWDVNEIVSNQQLRLGEPWQEEERAEIDVKETLHICMTKMEAKWSEDIYLKFRIYSYIGDLGLSRRASWKQIEDLKTHGQLNSIGRYSKD